MKTIYTLLLALILLASSFGKELLQLQGDNFELALTSYKYIAILFYDDSRTGNSIRREWVEASNLATNLPSDSEMAMVTYNCSKTRIIWFMRHLLFRYPVKMSTSRS
jgi:hypothetical protein